MLQFSHLILLISHTKSRGEREEEDATNGKDSRAMKEEGKKDVCQS